MMVVVAATQGVNQHIRSSLGFAISLKDTLTCRPGESIQRPSDNKTLALPLSHSRPAYISMSGLFGPRAWSFVRLSKVNDESSRSKKDLTLLTSITSQNPMSVIPLFQKAAVKKMNKSATLLHRLTFMTIYTHHVFWLDPANAFPLTQILVYQAAGKK